MGHGKGLLAIQSARCCSKMQQLTGTDRPNRGGTVVRDWLVVESTSFSGRNGVESWSKRQPIVGGSPRARFFAR